jgi:hypothetical protein
MAILDIIHARTYQFWEGVPSDGCRLLGLLKSSDSAIEELLERGPACCDNIGICCDLTSHPV